MQTFAQMTTQERAAWQAWARSHDWGRHALFEGAGDAPGPFLMVNLHPSEVGNEMAGGHCKPDLILGHRVGFRDPETLRIWAGY